MDVVKVDLIPYIMNAMPSIAVIVIRIQTSLGIEEAHLEVLMIGQIFN